MSVASELNPKFPTHIPPTLGLGSAGDIVASRVVPVVREASLPRVIFSLLALSVVGRPTSKVVGKWGYVAQP
jgi:hypothetical protein